MVIFVIATQSPDGESRTPSVISTVGESPAHAGEKYLRFLSLDKSGIYPKGHFAE